MKNNSQAMLVLFVAARTGGTNNLYYWTEARQKKTDAVRVTLCRTSACGGLVAVVALLAAAAVLVLAQFVRGRAPASERPYFFVTTASELTTPTTSVGAPSSESAIALQAAAVSKVSQLMQC